MLKSKKVLSVILTAVIVFASVQVLSAGSLPGKGGNPTKVKLPVSVEQFTKLYGKIAKSTDGDGNYAEHEWNLAKGVNVVASYDQNKMIQKLSVTAKNKTTVIKDCIMGFVINKSTVAECKSKLGNGIYPSLDEHNGKEGYKLNKDNSWIYVYFENGILSEIIIATWEYDNF